MRVSHLLHRILASTKDIDSFLPLRMFRYTVPWVAPLCYIGDTVLYLQRQKESVAWGKWGILQLQLFPKHSNRSGIDHLSISYDIVAYHTSIYIYISFSCTITDHQRFFHSVPLISLVFPMFSLCFPMFLQRKNPLPLPVPLRPPNAAIGQVDELLEGLDGATPTAECFFWWENPTEEMDDLGLALYLGNPHLRDIWFLYCFLSMFDTCWWTFIPWFWNILHRWVSTCFNHPFSGAACLPSTV